MKNAKSMKKRKNQNLDFINLILDIFGSKTLKTHQNYGFRIRGPSKNARGYRFHAYKWSNHHITSIIDIVFMFSLENNVRTI